MAIAAATIGARLEAHDEILLVTGAGGWLGRALVQMLAAEIGERVAQRVVLCGSSSRPLRLLSGAVLPIYALDEGLARLGDRPSYICHFAFLTKDRAGQMGEREYIERNRALADRVLGAAAGRNVRGVLLSSSGAVYGYLRADGCDRAANLYGMLKAEDERRFARLCELSGIPLVVPRIFNVSGPFINKLGAYALATIIVDVLRGGPVKLRATHPVYRSYVHVADILDVSLCGLLDAAERGDPGTLMFDACGRKTLEIGTLARRVCRALGQEGMSIVRPDLTSDVADRYIGDPSRFEELVLKQCRGLIGLDRQILDTAAYIGTTLESA